METAAEKKANLFVNRLLTEGGEVPCDDTVDSFIIGKDKLPEFYDEKLFKQGQAFFQKHLFSMLMANIFALLFGFSIPSVLKLLMHTKMSSSNFTAYRRYMETIFHLLTWYESDFKEGSNLWRSIRTMRNLHNSVSNKGYRASINRISQKDMALAQYGFVGIPLVTNSSIGIYNATEDEWKGFIHLWRVLGYLLGIENKFNTCQGTLEEITAISKILTKRVCSPGIAKNYPDAKQMGQYLINGMQGFQPYFDYNAFNCLLIVLLKPFRDVNYNNNINNTDNNNNASVSDMVEYKVLNFKEKCILWFIIILFYCAKWPLIRWAVNGLIRSELYLAKNFPIFAYAKFGYKKSNVIVHIKK